MRAALGMRSLTGGVLTMGVLGCDPVSQGDQAWDEGSWELAASRWEEAQAELDPERLGRLARALYRSDQQEKAALLLDSIPFDERSAEAHLVAGLFLISSGSTGPALEAFEWGLSLQPLPELYVNSCLARIALQEDPLPSCQSATEQAPQDPRAYLGLTEASLLMDARPGALASLRAAQSHLGEDAALWEWAAALAERTGLRQEACQWSSLAGEASSSLDLGRRCLDAGRQEQAYAALEPLGREQHPRALELLIRLELDQAEEHPPGSGRVQALARARRWERALSQRAEPASLVNDLGRLCRLEGDVLEAERLWAEAIEQAPGLLAPRINLARSLSERDALEDALRTLDAGELVGDDQLAAGVEGGKLLLKRGKRAQGLQRLQEVERVCREQQHAACLAEISWTQSLERVSEDADLTLLSLQQAVQWGGEPYRIRAHEAIEFTALRQDPRFYELLGMP